MKNVLILIGSLREGSYNRQLAGEVERIMGSRVRTYRSEWEDLPLFNQDLEVPVPAPVERVRDDVRAADALWICSPEYNEAIPGGIKNTIDWLSRPVDPADQRSEMVLAGKTVAISGVGGKDKTNAMRAQMKALCEYLGMHVVAKAGFGVTLDAEEWQTGRLVLSNEEHTHLAQIVDEFLRCIGA